MALIDMAARLKDVDNQTDSYNIGEVNAYDNLKQDDITIFQQGIADEKIDRQIYTSLHYFGEHIDRPESIRVNYHKTFDYVRTANCRLPFIPNAMERAELEMAYDRGITRWHYDVDNLSIGDDFLNFNRELINLSNNQMEATE